MIEINDALSIPNGELWFIASRSSGPGGQHVNKVNSRVTLHFDCRNSPSLSTTQRRRITHRLATRINKDGLLLLRCQIHRSQTANREELVRRFVALLREALRSRKRRIVTRPSQNAIRRRLDQKRQRGQLKRIRSKRAEPDD